MVAYMNGHTDRYKTFVCHAGCYDWVSMMATDGYRFFADELGAFHWDNPARVMRQSPHHYVKRAKTPTLVIHGELDYRVPATQALQYYDTLKAKNVPARLVYFPDENHWILKPQNSRLWYREFFDWVARYAPGGPARRRRPDALPRRGGAASDRGQRRSAQLALVGALAVDAALRGRVGRQPGRRDRLAAIDTFAVRAVAHPGERGVHLGQVRQHMPDLGEVELGEPVGHAPFVAAFLDPVAQADDAFVAAAGELRLHFDAKRGAARLELGFQARLVCGGQCVLGHGEGQAGLSPPLSHFTGATESNRRGLKNRRSGARSGVDADGPGRRPESRSRRNPYPKEISCTT